MYVTSIRLQNFRSFVDSGEIKLSRINVLIGANNAGKSTVLRGLQHLQQGGAQSFPDVRFGAKQARIKIGLNEDLHLSHWVNIPVNTPLVFSAEIKSANRRTGKVHYSLSLQRGAEIISGEIRLPSTEPHHFIVPYLSKRKVGEYDEDIREASVQAIEHNVSKLAAKLSRLGNPAYPAHNRYVAACKDILGFTVTAVSSPNGQLPGVYLSNDESIFIDQLGEGVPNIVHLLANLSVSEGKLFLIEEPENDLHPQALKALLDLIIDSSNVNQFVISTHSNIVVRHLCSATGSQLFRVRPKSTQFPIESEIEKIPDTADARLSVLSELGYSFSDFELWEGWLILEESSAERIIRDFLIPWFTPTLSRVRTISSGGATKVNATFEELHRLFLFTHLTPAYKNYSWVLTDGDTQGRDAIAKLKSKFQDYEPDRFSFLNEPSFEKYYPTRFANEAKTVLGIQDENKRREAKKRLLLDVIDWLDGSRDEGKKELATTAAEVIGHLRIIEKSILARRVTN